MSDTITKNNKITIDEFFKDTLSPEELKDVDATYEKVKSKVMNDKDNREVILYTLVNDDILSHMVEYTLSGYINCKSRLGYTLLKGNLDFDDNNQAYKMYIFIKPALCHGELSHYSLNNTWSKPVSNLLYNYQYKLVTPNVFIDDAIEKLDRLIDDKNETETYKEKDYRIFTDKEMKANGAKYQYKGRMYS